MTLQINTSTGQRALTTEEQTEVRDGIGAQSAAQVTAAASSAAATTASAAVAAHVAAADPHPGQYATPTHTHALLMTQPERDKLAGIATAATANAADAALRDRSTHTGTQPVASVDGLQTALDGKAPSAHTHTAAQISDATAAGRGLLTAADAAAQRTVLELGNVNNTADAQKPVSTAQAAAIAAATTADAIADTLETAPPAELARIQASVSGAQFISAANYGLSSSASAAVNTAALVSFRNAVAMATTANQAVYAIIPPGLYNVAPMLTAGADPYAGLPNWAIKGLMLDTTGATFMSTGSAPVFWGDGGRTDTALPVASRAVYPTSVAGVYSSKLKGLRVAAPNVGAAGKALSFTKMHHGHIGAEVIQTNGIGIDIGFVVAARIEYAISVNRGDFGGLVPSKGMLIRQDAIAGDWGTASYLDIVSPIIEGVNVGVEMTGGLGCSFWGGAIEGNTGRAIITSGPSHHNRFVGVDFEANPAGDFLIGSNYIDIVACDTLNDIVINGNFCNVDGGRHNNIHLGATSNNCRIACAYNAVDGLGVLQDLGQKNTLTQARDASTGWVGRKYNRYNSAPVGSEHLITNTSGDQWMLSYSGGAGVKCYTSLGGNAAVGPGVAPNGEMPLQQNTNMFLMPGQTVVLANWTTPPTDIVVWR